MQEIYWEAEQETRGEPSELHAGLVPMEEERKGKRMHGVSQTTQQALPFASKTSEFAQTHCAASFVLGMPFSPRLLNFSSRCFFLWLRLST